MVLSRYLRDKIASYSLVTEPLKAPLTTGLGLPKSILNGGVEDTGEVFHQTGNPNLTHSLQPYRVAEIEILIACVFQG